MKKHTNNDLIFPSSYGVLYLINALMLQEIHHWHGTKILTISGTKNI